jgi:NAD(P)H dehydrogenase (quinone)
MAKILIIYYSKTGNTSSMAGFIGEGIKKEGVELKIADIGDVTAKDLLVYDGIVIGSPTYYGTMCYQIKQLFDESVKFHGQLDGKVGAAFSSSANVGGGNETTVLDILAAMLIHGMIIQGDPKGDHYGPVAIGSPDVRSIEGCVRFGHRIAKLVKKIKNE